MAQPASANYDPRRLIERDMIVALTARIGRLWTLTDGPGLRVFERAASLRISHDAYRPQPAAKCLSSSAGCCDSASDHADPIDAAHLDHSQFAGAVAGGTKQRRRLGVGNTEFSLK
jgi:hypothetical protein